MEPITVSITRSVQAGREAEFEAALHEFVRRSLQTPGQGGVQILRPAPGSESREYGILRRFENAAARDAFYDSAVFHDWLTTVEPLVEGEPHYETLSGLETWFTLPGKRAIVPPPRWKMALVTLLGVYPASLLVPQVLHPLNGAWPLLLKALLNAAGIVALLTWLIMPQLTRLLHRWLYPAK